MKCEDCWSWMETGNVVRRLLARRHAARCPSCRASLAKLEAVRHGLAPAESPSHAQRKLWERAMAADVPCPALPKFRVAIAAVIGMAAVAALASGTWMAGFWSSREEAPVAATDHTAKRQESPPGPQIGPQTVEERPNDEPLRRIDELKSSLLALSAELDQLSRSASLLEERKQVSQLLSDHEQL